MELISIPIECITVVYIKAIEWITLAILSIALAIRSIAVIGMLTVISVAMMAKLTCGSVNDFVSTVFIPLNNWSNYYLYGKRQSTSYVPMNRNEKYYLAYNHREVLANMLQATDNFFRGNTSLFVLCVETSNYLYHLSSHGNRFVINYCLLNIEWIMKDNDGSMIIKKGMLNNVANMRKIISKWM